MRLCDDDHEEVCYEGKNCPVCTAKSEAADAEQVLNDKIEELTAELEEARAT